MDPDTALAEARAAIAQMDALDAAEDEPYYIEKYANAAEEAAQAYRKLDDWLSKGGFKPQAWRVQTH